MKLTRRVNTQTRKQRPTRLSSHLRAENVRIVVFEAEHFQEGKLNISVVKIFQRNNHRFESE